MTPALDIPDSLRPLLARVGAAQTALDAFEQEHGADTRHYDAVQIADASALILAVINAKSAVRTAWREATGGTARDAEICHLLR